MATLFDNAPLVEIVAEVRWVDPTAFTPPGSPMSLHMPGGDGLEEFVVGFGSRAYAKGLVQVERLIPHGMPIPVGQVSHRYRFAGSEEASLNKSTLWQIGPGVFAANAVPPYKSWTQFRPLVLDGLQAMLESRPEAVRNFPLSVVSLRYIDAFTSDFKGNLPDAQFLHEKLGISINFPDSLAKLIAGGSNFEQVIQVSASLEDGAKLVFSVSPGETSGKKAIIMTTAIFFEGNITPDLDLIMNRLDAARDKIHEMFEKMTFSIHDVLQAREV